MTSTHAALSFLQIFSTRQSTLLICAVTGPLTKLCDRSECCVIGVVRASAHREPNLLDKVRIAVPARNSRTPSGRPVSALTERSDSQRQLIEDRALVPAKPPQIALKRANNGIKRVSKVFTIPFLLPLRAWTGIPRHTTAYCRNGS